MGKEHLSRSERLDRFVNLDVKKGRQIRYLNDMHQQVIALRKMGRKNTEIAKMLNISTEWVKAIRFSWLGEQEAARLDELRDDVVLDFVGKMQKGSDFAVDFLVEALDVDTEVGKKFEALLPLKLKVATDFLDRDVRAAKVTRVQSTKLVAHATVDDLMRFKERAKEIREAAAKAAKAAQIEQTEPINVTPKEVQDAAT